MAWLETDTQTDLPKEEDKWLKIPDAPMGKTSEVKIRILDEVPEDAWRHWIDNRLFVCSGISSCPVCKVRQAASKSDPENYKQTYKMDHRYFFNVLSDNKVKVYSFGNSVGRKLKTFVEKYGDLRDYDVSILKRKTGPAPMNVEYDVIFEGKRLLSDDETYIAEGRYDLSQYKKPSSREDLELVARGELPAFVQPEVAVAAVKAATVKATKADLVKLEKLIKAKDPTLDLADFGIVDTSSKEVVDKLISEISAK